MKILIINGPNLNMLGQRETSVYGEQDFESYLNDLSGVFSDIEITYFQSNIEGEIIDALQNSNSQVNGVLLNAGGYTHTSVAIRDAITAIKTPVVEVHISNIYAREEFRHESLLSAKCVGVIAGFGLESYKLAINYFKNLS